jgi:hypothetical protein
MTDHIHRRIGAILTLAVHFAFCAFIAGEAARTILDYAVEQSRLHPYYAVAQAREAGR